MSTLEVKRKSIKRVLRFPLTRIAVGVVVCGIALLGTNSGLRFVLGSESDLLRIVRWILSTLVLLATYSFLFRNYEGREITELSRENLLKESLIGLFTGAFSITLIIIVLYVLGYYEVLSTISAIYLLLPLFMFITLSVFEELVFRGIIYRIAEESLGTNLALMLSALLFGLAHLPNENANAISVFSAASGGILAGLLFSMTKRLWLPIFFHAGWNWAQGSLGVTVSGIEEMPGFVQSSINGPELITGGAFGPENSIYTIALVLVLSGVTYYLTWKMGNVVRKADIASGEAVGCEPDRDIGNRIFSQHR
jgi:membrane protease YdiL (CAAX protease family)